MTYYNDPAKYGRIFDVNRNQIRSPGLIYVGQVIRIP